MRIAILHYTAPPVIGGVEKVMGDQAAALRNLGHEVTLLTRATAPSAFAGYDAVIVHNVFTMPFDLEWTRQLREMAAASSGVRWINWVHDVAAVNPYYAHLPWRDAAHAMLSEPVPNAVTVTVSEVRRQDYARACGLDLSQVQVIPNGIDLASVLGLTARVAALGLWRHDLILFHPTRLIRRKNIELGIRLCAALEGRGCRAVYAVSGAPDPHQADGVSYFGELQTLASGLGVADQVLFLGQGEELSDADVRGLYALADCLFFPSKGEGFGLPLLEAVLHRLPIFCSDLAVHQEVNEGMMDTFSLEGSPEDIASQVLTWMANTPEIGRRRQVWRRYDMRKICQERLEPLLQIR